MALEAEKTDVLKIGLSSPETILGWSYGEVKKPETINYRTHRTENEGLFCDKIFGPTKNYNCRCGRYSKQRDEGIICEDCGVEVAHSTVRRERMGHIALAEPIVHYWYFKRNNFVSTLLNMKNRDIESVVYCQKYVVIDPKETPLEKKQVLTEKEYSQVYKQFGNNFEVSIGGKAIKKLLQEIDLDELSEELREKLKEGKKTVSKELSKRLMLVEDFKKSGNRPEWMVLDFLPVLPADLRPLVQLDGGRFATSDLNELYRRIINRNNRLQHLLKLGAPSIIVENEVRMLQSAVDSIIDNQRRSKPVVGAGNRPLKSLSSYLEGKGGRFRQNLLGKRVDFSGRSVIIAGPKLKLNQVGIPREMALELFKPFILGQMVKLEYVETAKQAKRKIENRSDKMWDVLDKIVKNHPVLLNRAPTLHRLSIRAFEPVIVEGKAIRLHPLVCSAYNADFDGDTMSVHVPISREAQTEARVLLMATKNLLHPQSGKTSTSPSQDMVLGCYYLSLEGKGKKGEGKFFSNFKELLNSYYNKFVDIHAKVIVSVEENEKFEGKYLVTTVGKVMFNQNLPKEIPFINDGIVDFSGKVYGLFVELEDALEYLKRDGFKPFDSSFLKEFISEAFNEFDEDVNVELLDAVKDVGFSSSTQSGLTFALKDIILPTNKAEIIGSVSSEIDRIEECYQYGRISKNDRYEFVIKCWEKVSKKVADSAMDTLDNAGFNPIEMMMSSGARGSKNQFRQLAAMRGLMADPSGRPIERPILANFKEGLDELDYFISSHGARKGQADTAIKTADAGYLTRRLVDAAHDVVVNTEDCGTDEYINVRTIDAQITPPTETLEERVEGRILARHLIDSDGVIVFEEGTLVNRKMAKKIAENFKEVPIRTALKCKAERGICKKCYGYDLSNNEMVEKGEAVGVIAAQSIGEPGTQLTMRTFHAGGVAGNDITQGLPRIVEILEARKTLKGEAILTSVAGTVEIIDKNRVKEILITDADGNVTGYNVGIGIGISVENGQYVEVGERLTIGSINPYGLMELRGMAEVQRYLLEEIQRVYRSQGVSINDKHVEIIIRQMTKKIKISNVGDSEEVLGGVMEKVTVDKINEKLEREGKETIEYMQMLMGITEASLASESFLSAASFQETPKILTEAAIKGKIDMIHGLKEAVIVGKKIPAGTGFKDYLK